MSKIMYFPEDAKHSGVDIQYTKCRRELQIGGWYDDCVGIKPSTIGLGDFLRGLGVTLKDCEKEFKK